MKTVTLIAVGFILHMLYLDLILIQQHRYLDSCPQNVSVSEDEKCMEYSNKTSDRYYLKYFGIYYLIKWDYIHTGKWSVQ